jgi:hypothetical protein
MRFDDEDDDDSKLGIYHVPSFLLKTYEIVDVNIYSHYIHIRTRNMIALWLGLLMENPLLLKNKMNFPRLYCQDFSSITIFHLSLGSLTCMISIRQRDQIMNIVSSILSLGKEKSMFNFLTTFRHLLQEIKRKNNAVIGSNNETALSQQLSIIANKRG